jgi:hypothetical protein
MGPKLAGALFLLMVSKRDLRDQSGVDRIDESINHSV